MIVPAETSSAPVQEWLPRPAFAAGTPGAIATPAIAGAPAAGAIEIDPIALLKATLRRWRLVIPLGLLLGVAAAVAAWFGISPPKYTATARLLVPEVPPRFMYTTRETGTNYQIFRQTQLVLIKSQKVLDAVLRKPEVQALEEIRSREDPTAWLRENVNADFPQGAEVLEIRMSGFNPNALATIVNATNDAYLNEVVNVDYSGRQERLKKLREFEKTLADSLRNKRENLRRLVEASSAGDKATLGVLQQLELDRQSSMRKQLVDVQAKLAQARIELAAKEAEHEGTEELSVDQFKRLVNERLDKDPVLVSHTQTIEQYEDQVKQLKRTARNPGKDPLGVALEDALKVERRALFKRHEEILPTIETDIRRQIEGAAERDLRPLRSEIDLLTRLEDKYLEEIDKIQEQRVESNLATFDRELLESEVKRDEKATSDLGDEIKHLEIELDLAPPRVQGMERALVPRVKDKDKRPVMASAAGLGVFCLIALAIGFWEHRARRITSIDEVAGDLGLAIVGSIPQLPNPGRPSRSMNALESPRQSVWNNLLIESVDATRTMLLRATQAEGLRVVMITSANVGEGKSTLAGHLATSLARSGRRVLLIDGDLRRPIAHRVYDVSLSPGFCEWLRNETPFDSIIRETAAPNLWLAPAGLCDATALAELARRDLGSLFVDLKEAYDYVIVDSSPVLPVVDASVIGQHVDAALLSIMNERSRTPEVQETYELLRALGVRVLGAVIAGTRARRTHYSSYAYYGVDRGVPPLDQG